MKWLNNLKIGRKLLIVFVFLGAATLAIGITGYIGLTKMQTSFNEVVDVRMYNIELVTDIKGAQANILVAERGLLIYEELDELRQAQYDYIDTHMQVFDENWGLYDLQPKTQEEQQLWNSIIDAKNIWINDHNNMLELSIQKDELLAAGKNLNDIAVQNLNNQVYDASLVSRDSYLGLNNLLQELIDVNKTEADARNSQAKGDMANSVVLLVVFVAAGIAFTTYFSIIISGGIRKQVEKALGFVQVMSKGDLTTRAAVDTKDEIGLILKTLNSYADSLGSILRDIYEAAEQVASGADQVAGGSQELSQGATEQASSVEQLTSSVSEIAAQTKQNADNANNANALGGEAMANANTGNSQMREMLKSMENINESSANISKIIKVIDEIAFQTNILALNAAVEAARAGQQGKGFAVVAEEVRNLAAKSAQAAKETTALIETSIQMVGSGTSIAKKTAESLERIVENISRAAELIGQIAVASNEQAAGIAQIDQGIEQVSQVVQSNSATAEQSASASEELSGQAQLLKEMVGKFKLDNDRKGGTGEVRATTSAKPVAASGNNKDNVVINLKDNEFGKY